MMRPLVMFGWLISLWFFGCGGESPPEDAGSRSDAVIACTFPEIPQGCPPNNGNEQEIGKPCSIGGGQCPKQLVCACEIAKNYGLPEGTPCFCTKIVPSPVCPTNINCGTNASCCPVGLWASGCFPHDCLTNLKCPEICREVTVDPLANRLLNRASY